MASLLRKSFILPKPLLNSYEAKILTIYGKYAISQGQKAGGWALPLAIVAGWLIFPALTLDFKRRLGLASEPAVTSSSSSISYESEEIDKMPVVVEK